MAKIDSAYAYYVSTYGNQKTSRYDSHKKSELRKVYNSIMKANKESPLYKLSNMDEAKRFAIDIKERAKTLQNVVSSLTSAENQEQTGASFQKKVAVSSNEASVQVEYVGNGTEQNVANQFEISVKQLAESQVNRGNYLKPDALSITPGTYAFDLTTNAAAYEFQYSVGVGDSNLDVQEKLARLVNGSNIKIAADVVSNEKGMTALELKSEQTGLDEGEDYLFSIVPEAKPGSMRAMDLLGINQVVQESKNSEFYLNGREQHSLSNTFTINNTFEITLNAPNAPDNPTAIFFKANTDAVADNLQGLLDAYNRILDTAEMFSSGNVAAQGHRLFYEMNNLVQNRAPELGSIGIRIDDNFRLSIDRDILSGAINPERAEDTFRELSAFRDALGRKADSIGINPMSYVDKVVVEYKNPGKTFATPYITSIYSGLMLDNLV